jgi:[ribosomal protein S18]-alanine N-acetyltransferase
MTIRRATVGDIPRLIAIAQESDSAGHWTVSQYEQALTESPPLRVVLVLEERGEVAGFVVAAEIAREWELENIAVSVAARQKGYAGRLMSALLGELRKAAAESIYLEVRVSNLPARSLYDKWGFQQVGVRPGYYHNPSEDAILYKKNLVTAAREMG